MISTGVMKNKWIAKNRPDSREEIDETTSEVGKPDNELEFEQRRPEIPQVHTPSSSGMPKPKDKSVVNLEECANFTVTFEVLFEKAIEILERQR